MGDKVLNDIKNLKPKPEKRKISRIENIELKSNELLIRQNGSSSKDNDLESEIEKCKQILSFEENAQDEIFSEVIETNELENEVKNFYELIKRDSFGDTDSFQTYLNFSSVKNKDIPISMQSDKYTQSLSKYHNFKETDNQNQIKPISENSHYSPEKKKIKLFTDELNFDNKLETSIQTSEDLSCTRIITEEKFDLIKSVNSLPNISLNEKTQSYNTFANSAINDNKVKANLSNGNDVVDFTLHGNNKTLFENEDSIKNCDLKIKPIFEHIEKIDGINSMVGNESRRESCETNYSGDVLILHHEESDIDSEIERCTELLSQNSSEMSVCSKINSDKSFQNCNHIDSNDSSENDNVTFQGTSYSNSNEALLLEVENETSNSVDSTQLLNDESDIESEIEKCNELLNLTEAKTFQVIKTEKKSQTYDNLFHLKNIEKEKEDINPIPGTIESEINSEFQDNLIHFEIVEEEIEDIEPIPGTIKSEINSEFQDNLIHFEIVEEEIEDIKPIPGTIKCEINSEFQNIITLNEKSCEKEIKQNSEPEINIVTLNEISDKENSEIQNMVIVDDKSPSKETEIDKKILFSNITSQKRHPERIFKLAMKSINEISNENTNSVAKFNNNSSDKNNNSLSLSKLNCKEVSKDKRVVKDYFEDEKDDITNPEWQAVKNLSTNEERYQQVRKCWKSRTVPDPNKNLTYHSYRKRLFRSGSHEERPIRQHKRHASSSLPGREAKRPCTFFLDREIDSIKRTKDIQKQKIINKMNNKINSKCPSREQSTAHHPLDRINRATNITHEYSRIVDTCENSFRNKMCALYERRNEVLKFYSFYKGLNDSCDDPTLLTDSQFQELDEIENIYRQFNCFYGDLKN